MTNSSILLLLVVLLLSSCGQKENHKPPQHQIKVVEAKGYVVPQDSMSEPRVIEIDENKLTKTPVGTPKVIATNTNVQKADTTKIVPVGEPRVIALGQDTLSLPKTVPAVDSPFVAGVPEVVVAKDAYVNKRNPESFSGFSKLQGLKDGRINDLLQDSRGYLWFATQAGVTRYDGKNFTHFTESDGLSNNYAMSIIEDKSGNLWFGTYGGGVTKYDGSNFTHFTEKEGLSNNYVLYIIEDKSGNLWISCYGGGVSKYDGKNFTHFTENEGLPSNNVWELEEDKNGNIWFGTDGGGVTKFDGDNFTYFTVNEGLSGNSVLSILADKSGNLWFGTDNGVTKYDGNNFTHFTENAGLTSTSIWSILEDSHGDLWFGTWGGGVCRFNGKNFIKYSENEGLSNNNCVWSMIEDNVGNVWLGTDGSLMKYNGNSFRHFTENEGLSNNMITSILEDRNKNLWFGTEIGVSKFDGNNFKQFTENQGLSKNLIYSIIEDKNGNIWFGTYGGGISKFNGKNFTHFTQKDGLLSDLVLDILEDKNGNLWFGTYEGVTKYDGNSFTHFTVDQGLCDNLVFSILEDKSGNLWFGTIGGVTKYDGHSFTHFTENEGLSGNLVRSILEDKNGNLWFATIGGGVTIFDGKNFTHFTENEGLSNNSVFSISEDIGGNIWVGTNSSLTLLKHKGNAKFVSKNENINPPLQNTSFLDYQISNYAYEDGFYGIGVKSGKTIVQDQKGYLWVASGGRLTRVNVKSELFGEHEAPKVTINALELFNEQVQWLNLKDRQDSIVTLQNGVNVAGFKFDGISKWNNLPENLSLAYNNNSLTFKFIGVTMHQPNKVKYQYKLEGFDENWSALTFENEAPYGNLPHGKYIFKCKAMNSEGNWSEVIEYPFEIRPPWWHTWWARTLYVLIAFLSIYYFIRRRTKKLLIRQQELEKEVSLATSEIRIQKEIAEEEREKAIQSEAVKSQFLANMSHEIRTPMNAVSGMTSLVLESNLDDKQRSYLEKIRKSSDNLLQIINDILDFSKIEVGKMELEEINFSIKDVVDQVTQVVKHKADEKGLELIVKIDPKMEDIVLGDPLRLNQVLINLAGNAIKFTEKGSVTIEVSTAGDQVKFAVIDTGIGIPKEKLQHVFESFNQASASDTRKYGGTGLGLSITQQLVKLMGGNINVDSTVGRGTTFSFKVQFKSGDVTAYTQRIAEQEHIDGSILNGLKIMIVDDNEYNRIVARDMLLSKAEVIIVEAVNGQEAIDKLDESIDIILMDGQMPIMNGFDATKQIRALKDEKLRNVPVIAFTASVMRSELDKCKDAGMTGYIPKPFRISDLIKGIAQELNIEIRTKKAENVQSALNSIESITDMDFLLDFCEGDEDKMKKYIEMFLSSAPSFLVKLEKLIKSEDAEGIANHVHGFHSKLTMMGMKDTKSIAIQVENTLRENGNLASLSEQLNSLKNQIKRGIEELKND